MHQYKTQQCQSHNDILHEEIRPRSTLQKNKPNVRKMGNLEVKSIKQKTAKQGNK
jgi:hypothetical protein